MLVRTDTSPRTIESTPTVLIDIEEPPPPPPPEDRSRQGATRRKARPARRPSRRRSSRPSRDRSAGQAAGCGRARRRHRQSPNCRRGDSGHGPGRGRVRYRPRRRRSAAAAAAASVARRGCWAAIPPGCRPACCANSAADRGFGYLLLTISEAGRVSDCSVLQSTGDARGGPGAVQLDDQAKPLGSGARQRRASRSP